ncbi:MAG: response regulator [Anaerolineae bacterium]
MSINQWKVLVVEDEFDSAQMMSLILKHYGIEVEVAHNGKECLQALEGGLPTAIVLDLMMPEMDGWVTLQKIRSNRATAQLPVVAVTAYYSVEIAAEAQRAGFDGFFHKPVSPATFVESLEKIIQQ